METNVIINYNTASEPGFRCMLLTSEITVRADQPMNAWALAPKSIFAARPSIVLGTLQSNVWDQLDTNISQKHVWTHGLFQVRKGAWKGVETKPTDLGEARSFTPVSMVTNVNTQAYYTWSLFLFPWVTNQSGNLSQPRRRRQWIVRVLLLQYWKERVWWLKITPPLAIATPRHGMTEMSQSFSSSNESINFRRRENENEVGSKGTASSLSSSVANKGYHFMIHFHYMTHYYILCYCIPYTSCSQNYSIRDTAGFYWTIKTCQDAWKIICPHFPVTHDDPWLWLPRSDCNSVDMDQQHCWTVCVL